MSSKFKNIVNNSQFEYLVIIINKLVPKITKVQFNINIQIKY